MSENELELLLRWWKDEPGDVTWGVFTDAVQDFEQTKEWWLARVFGRFPSELPRLAWSVCVKDEWPERAELARLQAQLELPTEKNKADVRSRVNELRANNDEKVLDEETRELLRQTTHRYVWNEGFVCELRGLISVDPIPALLRRQPVFTFSNREIDVAIGYVPEDEEEAGDDEIWPVTVELPQTGQHQVFRFPTRNEMIAGLVEKIRKAF